ncbi:MAG: PQQ-binding-like beta-propeller repeat protein [Chryseolinea sp.]
MRPSQISATGLIIIWILATMLTSCSKKSKSEIKWSMDLPVIGSQSSPRAADLNGDHVLDIVMGAGKNEFQKSAQGILAFDGATGNILWQQEGLDQVYGSATFYDVNGDQVPDVFIGGRSPHFKALNGKSGEVLWEYHHEQHQQDSILKYARYNFNNSVLIPDQNNDGLMDLLVVNGGNAAANPNTEEGRFPGVLMVFDSKTGNILAADTMPDGKESYMSPVAFKEGNSAEGQYKIVFGTGGETINGHLYLAKLEDLMKRQLKNALIVAEEKGHGFVAPPSIADINGDGSFDIVAISHGSTVFAINGTDGKMLWKQNIPNTESSNSLAVGKFNDDDTPDFFTFVSKGMWPNSTGSVQVLFDGKDGRIMFKDSLGCTGYSSPVVYDLTGDGIDEVIVSVNEFDCSVGFAGKPPAEIENKLVAFDFMRKQTMGIAQTQGFKNIFSTPWLGDIDDDGFLDLVYCQYYNHGDLLLFLGMKISRIDLPVKISRPPTWGAYMGSEGDGIYRP